MRNDIKTKYVRENIVKGTPFYRKYFGMDSNHTGKEDGCEDRRGLKYETWGLK